MPIPDCLSENLHWHHVQSGPSQRTDWFPALLQTERVRNNTSASMGSVYRALIDWLIDWLLVAGEYMLKHVDYTQDPGLYRSTYWLSNGHCGTRPNGKTWGWGQATKVICLHITHQNLIYFSWEEEGGYLAASGWPWHLMFETSIKSVSRWFSRKLE